MFELPDQAVLHILAGQTQLMQPPPHHLEEEIGHVGVYAAGEEADADQAPEEELGRHGGAVGGEVERDEDAAGGVLAGWPVGGEAVGAPVGPVGEDEVVGCLVEGVADQLAMALRAVVVGQARDEGLDLDLARVDGQGVGSGRECEVAAVDAPVQEDVVEEAFLAAVADLGVGPAARTDDGGAVPGAGHFAAFVVTAGPLVRVEFDETWLGRRLC